MDNLSAVTQELVNIFPEWTRVRSDKQSVGYQILNSVAGHIEELQLNLQRVNDNLFLETFNLKEMDLLYKLDLSAFSFVEEFDRGVFLRYETPTVSGFYLDELGNEQNLSVTNIDDGSVNTFFNSPCNRISVGDSFQGVAVELQDINISLLNPPKGEASSIYPLVHHDPKGGLFFFSVKAGYPYLRVKDGELKRSRIRIVGINSQDEEDSETLVFPWESLMHTKKKWKEINYIETYDLLNINIHNDSTSQTSPTINVHSESVSQLDYISLGNLRFSNNRRKIDEFWGFINYDSSDPQGESSYLERVEYVSDDIQTLLRGTTDKFSKERTRLKAPSGNSVSEIKDIALIPYQDKFWAITESKLYLFSLSVENYEKFDKLQEGDPESEISITSVTEDVVTGESFNFSVWHERQITKINKIKVWYTTPGGVDVFLTNSGADGFVENQASNRILFQDTFNFTEEGDYILNASIELEDGSIQTCKRLARNRAKKALKEFDLSPFLATAQTAEGIYFDSKQDLILKTSGNNYHVVNQHKDIMLIDYTNKSIYLHEKYTKVTVE